MKLRRSHIQKTAKQLLLDTDCYQTPVAVQKVARSLGLTIRKVDEEDPTMSGFLLRQKNSTILGLNTNHHPNRQRFTIAHEIGHHLLHPQKQLYVDRGYRMNRDKLSAEGTDVREMEANLFAAELLMPKDLLVKDVRKLEWLDFEAGDGIRKLATAYRVSQQAMTNRLNYLDFLSI